jgi:hypothetical protein
MKPLTRIFAAFVGASTILLFVRFAVPSAGLCRQRWDGPQMETVCGGLIKFKGDDVLSIYRVSLINTPWRSK